MVTPQPFPSLISCDPECYAVLLAKLLEFSELKLSVGLLQGVPGGRTYYTISDDGIAFGVEAVHHGGKKFEAVLDGVREEIGIHEDGIWWNKSSVVLKEKRRGNLWSCNPVSEPRVFYVSREGVHFSYNSFTLSFFVALIFALGLVLFSV